MVAAAQRPTLSSRVLVTVVMIGLAGLIASPGFPYPWADSSSYIAMAQGLPAMMPWAGRILLPDIVAFLTKTGLSLDHGFEIVTATAFVVWAAIVIQRWPAKIWVAFLLITPLTIAGLDAVYITDMFSAAFVALFLLLLWQERFLWAALLMVAMVPARESTAILGVVAVGVLLFHRRWAAAVMILAAVAGGKFIVHHLTAGVENTHNMPELVYLVTKIPVNFLRNWVGVLLWTDGYAWCDAPVFTVSLPVHIGRITQLGPCMPSIAEPLATIASYLTIFGVLPAMLAGTIRAYGLSPEKWKESWWATAAIYGGLMVVLGPLAGEPPDREIGFGWPLFLIALPALRVDRLWAMASLSVVASWSPMLFTDLVGSATDPQLFTGASMAPAVSLLSIGVGVGTNYAAYLVSQFPESDWD